MKLISLNTWGGAAGLSNLLDFFRTHRDIDIFCLQEIWNGGEHMRGTKAGENWLEDFVSKLYPEIAGALPDHAGYFRPHFGDWYGLAMFINNGFQVRDEGDIYVYKDHDYVSKENVGNHGRNLQYATIETPKGRRTILNLHGLWNGRGKGDSDDRLLQSDKIIGFLKHVSYPHVLCGDFNLLPETRSIKKLEEAGLRNLIGEYGIASTRSALYKKPLRHADYAMVSSGIMVNDFKVLPDEVSDHLALYLDFE